LSEYCAEACPELENILCLLRGEMYHIPELFEKVDKLCQSLKKSKPQFSE